MCVGNGFSRMRFTYILNSVGEYSVKKSADPSGLTKCSGQSARLSGSTNRTSSTGVDALFIFLPKSPSLWSSMFKGLEYVTLKAIVVFFCIFFKKLTSRLSLNLRGGKSVVLSFLKLWTEVMRSLGTKVKYRKI